MTRERTRLVQQQALAAEDAARELAASVATVERVLAEVRRQRAKAARRFDRLAQEIAAGATSPDLALLSAQIAAVVRTALYDLAGTPKRERSGCTVPDA